MIDPERAHALLPGRSKACWSCSPRLTSGPPVPSCPGWSARDLVGAAGPDLGYDPELAADGSDEIVTVIWPRQVQLGRATPLPVALAVAPDDASGRRVIAG